MVSIVINILNNTYICTIKVTVYRMVKNFGGKNFGESATVKHWQKKLWRIDAQKLLQSA